jgi:mannosyltransferase
MIQSDKAIQQRDRISIIILRLWWLWPLIAVIVTYFVIMIFSIGQAIWFDEGYSITLARRPLGELLALTAVDAHPPLYYIILKIWAGVFGWSEYAIRSMSAIAAALTVGVVFLMIRKLFTVRAALAVLPFLVLAPFALRYGYEVRMYAVASLIGALATLVLVYAYRRQSLKLWVLYAILVALGMYTLYMTAALWVAHVTWLMLVSRPTTARAFFRQPWLLAFVGAAVLFSPYLVTFTSQFLHSVLPGIGNVITLSRLGDIIGMILVYTPEWKVTGLVSLGLMTILIVSIYLLIVAHRTLPSNQRLSLLFIIVLVTVPVLFFAISSLGKPIFINRYMAHVVIYSYSLIGLAVALGWRFGKRIHASLLAILSIVLLVSGVVQLQQTGNFVFERMQYPRTADMRAAVTCDDSTTIVADDPYTYIDSAYYFGDCDLRFFAINTVEKRGGYAPLHNSSARVSSSDGLRTVSLIHLRWDGATPSFVPDGRYVLVNTATYDKQVIDEYRLAHQ